MRRIVIPPLIFIFTRKRCENINLFENRNNRTHNSYYPSGITAETERVANIIISGQRAEKGYAARQGRVVIYNTIIFRPLRDDNSEAIVPRATSAAQNHLLLRRVRNFAE